jgi:hypothetical protein
MPASIRAIVLEPPPAEAEDKPPQIFIDRKDQLEHHSQNFNKIWNFYLYLEEFTGKVISFMNQFYNSNNKDKIIAHAPTFYRKPSNENQRINPDFLYLYDQHVSRILQIKSRFAKFHKALYKMDLPDVVHECIEANPNWLPNYSHSFDQFDTKKSSITRMFSDLQINLDGGRAQYFAERLVNELIHTKKYIDDLFNMYISYSNYGFGILRAANLDNFDFKLFEEIISNIINNVNDDLPTYFDLLREKEDEVYERQLKKDADLLRQLRSVLPQAQTTIPLDYVAPDPSESFKLRYVGPSKLTERSLKLDLNDFKNKSHYLGGIKRRHSKRVGYLKAFKTYSKRKLKTFRKRHNYKKTKRNKH